MQEEFAEQEEAKTRADHEAMCQSFGFSAQQTEAAWQEWLREK